MCIYLKISYKMNSIIYAFSLNDMKNSILIRINKNSIHTNIPKAICKLLKFMELYLIINIYIYFFSYYDYFITQ